MRWTILENDHRLNVFLKIAMSSWLLSTPLVVRLTGYDKASLHKRLQVFNGRDSQQLHRATPLCQAQMSLVEVLPSKIPRREPQTLDVAAQFEQIS